MLVAIALAWITLSSGSASAAPSPQPTQLPAVTASRHPDTIVTKGPYQVAVRQLAGPHITGGQAIYSVRNARGEKVAEGQVGLQRTGNEKGWIAEIPGQRGGSLVNYYFFLITHGGMVVRHPARDPTSYQFRVVELNVRSVALPKVGASSADRPIVSLQVQAASHPSGEMVFRLLSSASDPAEDHRIALTIVKQTNGVNASATYVMEARLPNLRPGELADFYFQLRTAEGAEVRIPADAPIRVYTVKRPIRALQSLPGNQFFVLDIGALGRQRWIAFKGGGAWVWEDDWADHWGLGKGLPSGVARFLLPDPVNGIVYVGTNRGVTAIEPGGNSWVDVIAPYPSAWIREPPALNRLGRTQRAGPGALSTLDGTLLFQLQAAELPDEAHPHTVFLEFRDGKLSEWARSPSSLPVVGLSSATFDTIDGCWLLGGFVSRSNRALRPVVVRRCGELEDQIPLQDFLAGESWASPERIVALTRDPLTGDLVGGLEFMAVDKRRRRKDYGVYRIEQATGQLSPLTPELAAIGAEVTSLATDWSRGRILVGTFGRGLSQVQGGRVQRLDYVPSAITTIKVDEDSGSILVGTSRGAFEVHGDGTRVSPFHPGEGLLTDGLPMDVDSITGRVLLSSYSEGLVQLERGTSGRWQAVEQLRPGRELLPGLFGDAQYNPSGGMSVVLHSRGLLRVENKRATLFSPAEGLHGTHLLRLLVRRSGDTWLAYTPMPFGTDANAAVQIIRGDRIMRTVKVANRNLATIGRWLEVPTRDSVFAATRAGVVEIHENGSMTRLSRYSSSSIAHDPHTGSIGAVGTSVERWDGTRFVPVLFQLDHSRWPRGRFQAGSPIDLAIDKLGIWYLLFKGGILALLDSEGRFLGLLDPEDGIPSTARRLLAHPTIGAIFVGSSSEGLVVVLPTNNE